MRIIDLKADVYGWDVKVVICNDVNKNIRYFSSIGMKDITADLFDCHGRFFYKKHKLNWKTAFIWLPQVTKRPKCIATVSHELLHATGFILDWASVKYSYDNDEAFTYLLGHLTEQFWTKIQEK